MSDKVYCENCKHKCIWGDECKIIHTNRSMAIHRMAKDNAFCDEVNRNNDCKLHEPKRVADWKIWLFIIVSIAILTSLLEWGLSL